MINKFSVLLSVYIKENPEYLKLALLSIWDNQSLKPSEIVIVKDGPLTPELDLVISNFASYAPVKFIINEVNIGLSASLNKGLKNCSNNIVARMDTDDISLFDRFSSQFEFLDKNPEVDICGSFAIKIDENGKEMGIIKVPILNQDIQRLIWTCPFIHPSVMFKRDSIITAGCYNPKSGPRQDDYELWFRCAEAKLIFHNINKPLLYYRFFSDSIKKNTIYVGWARFIVGLNGCRRLKCSPIAYLAITIPLIRSILPYPFNIYFQKLMDKTNPRNK